MSILYSLLLTFITSIFASSSPFVCNSVSVTSHQRIIAIGDIHGSYGSFMKLLAASNITNGITCDWISQDSLGTILLQIGDIVDRGPGAHETWTCLEQLQRTSPSNSKVVRLIGNHELWWLEGFFHDRNKQFDTKSKVADIVTRMKGDILSGYVMGAYAHKFNDTPFLFVHAGLRSKMLTYITDNYRHIDVADPSSIAALINTLLVEAIHACGPGLAPCQQYLTNEIFNAGPERGGVGIGGPFWTDFSVLQNEAQQRDTYLTPFIQV